MSKDDGKDLPILRQLSIVFVCHLRVLHEPQSVCDAVALHRPPSLCLTSDSGLAASNAVLWVMFLRFFVCLFLGILDVPSPCSPLLL